jgi:hypothetical protein
VLTPGWHALALQRLDVQCWPPAVQSASVLQATHTPASAVLQTSPEALHVVSLWHAATHWFWKQPKPEEQSTFVAQATQAPLLHTMLPGQVIELTHGCRAEQVPAMQACPEPHSAGLVHWMQT